MPIWNIAVHELQSRRFNKRNQCSKEKFMTEILCKCGHTENNHKMPGGVWGFKCIGNRNWCKCRKYKKYSTAIRRYGYSIFKCDLCQRHVTRWHNARVCWKPIAGAGNLHCKGRLVWIGNGEKRRPIPCGKCDGTGVVFVNYYSTVGTNVDKT